MYSTTAPSLREATLLAIQGLLQANLDAFNANLLRGGVWPCTAPITPAMVILGDPDTLWDVHAYPLLFCVFEPRDSWRQNWLYIRPQGVEPGPFENLIYTSVVCYLHPNVFSDSSVVTQASKRTTTLARASDYLRAGVLSNCANIEIDLTSQEYHTGDAYDQLTKAYVYEGFHEPYERSFGDKQTAWAVRVMHYGYAA